MLDKELVILIVGPFVWQRGLPGETISDVLAKLKKINSGRTVKHYVAHLVHKDTRIDEDGMITYPSGCTPILLDRRLPKEKKKAKS